MIDTHCHLTFPDFAGRVPAVLASAREAGVRGCITISTTTRDCVEALAIAESHEGVWCTAGVHPLYSDQGPHDWAAARRVAEREKCVAWGELGLDNHYPKPGGALQRSVLDEQLAFIEGVHRDWQAAIGGGVRRALPIVIHCREAFDDLIPVLRRTSLDPNRFVFHCFTGGPDDVRKILDFGAWVSFTGVVTYRNATEVQEAARLVPAGRIMVETDAPFLSPEPRRGTRPCEPWMVSLTARRLAEIRGEDEREFARRIDANARAFFALPQTA
jgi:TatD DNase family protein